MASSISQTGRFQHYLQANQRLLHFASSLPFSNLPIELKRIKSGPEQTVNDFLGHFTGSTRIIERLSMKEKSELLNFMVKRAEEEKSISPSKLLSHEGLSKKLKGELDVFLQRNQLSPYTLSIETSEETPFVMENVRPLHSDIQLPSTGEIEKTILVSHQDLAILEILSELENGLLTQEKSYALNVYMEEIFHPIDIIEKLPEFLFTLVFPPRYATQQEYKKYLSSTFGKPSKALLMNLLYEFTREIDGTKKYLHPFLESLFLSYLDPNMQNELLLYIIRRMTLSSKNYIKEACSQIAPKEQEFLMQKTIERFQDLMIEVLQTPRLQRFLSLPDSTILSKKAALHQESIRLGAPLPKVSQFLGISQTSVKNVKEGESLQGQLLKNPPQS